MSRPKIGIAIDYVLRIPEFLEYYKAIKKEILVGNFSDKQLAQVMATNEEGTETKEGVKEVNLAEDNAIKKRKKDKGVDNRDFWHGLQKDNLEAVKFYQNTSVPKDSGKDFDITYKSYFYNDEHLIRFLNEYSFNLFGTGKAINAADVNLINVAQKELADIVLIDRIPISRKITNTFTFLGKSGLFVKSVEFVTNQEAYDNLVKDCIAVWDPKNDPTHAIDSPKRLGKPTAKLLKFFMEVEKAIKNEKETVETNAK